MWMGKIVGTVFGLLIAGWAGAIVGFLVGHMIDERYYYNQRYAKQNKREEQLKQMRQVFFETTFLVMGYLAKADGRVSEDEIRAAMLIMKRMNLREDQEKQAIRFFNQGKGPVFNLLETLDHFLRICHSNPSLLQTFVDIQLQAIRASGPITAQKQQILNAIYQRLGYVPFEFHFTHFKYDYDNAYESSKSYRSERTSYRAPPPPPEPLSKLQRAYAVLGVSEKATNIEIKRAYRKLISKHHPDKLISKGLPEEMLRLATEKAQNIQLAYDMIRDARGF